MTTLGLDHALVAVRDLDAARATYQALGFLSRGLSQHPWGTSTMVLIFRDQLFEVVSLGAPELLDGYETGGFRFGRHVERHLREQEGVALTALNSSDAEADEAGLRARGIGVTGTIDFGRDVTRADGTADRTSTRLKILSDPRHPRLSLFACQQFRRDLIEYPEWMDHPNTATGIAGYTIVAPDAAREEIVARLAKIHDTSIPDTTAHDTTAHGTMTWADGQDALIATARGRWRVTDEAGFVRRYGVAPPLAEPLRPGICAIDIACTDPDRAAGIAAAAGLPAVRIGDGQVLQRANHLGGIVLRYAAGND
ncbi:VOC family protein [Acidimangrovimonas sediminis]|uniref:VOC family protein n=1 Tax=Acidimangrovimonas sediminis TaxID=2056283 RepID=UPI000C7FB3CB|nr:VOC family protein [Acidimangrovimonas sediminis]